MLFNSFVFIFLFLPICLLIYFTLNKLGEGGATAAKISLVLASLYFYAFFNTSYLLIILSSILVNYAVGHILIQPNRNHIIKKAAISSGVLFNLGLLGYFKYTDFFIDNINSLFQTNFPLLHILLPLGISFFTFQQISYIVDCYRGQSSRYSFSSYCLFVTFFPQLIAGPIVLPSEMLPQFEDANNKRINIANINKGLYIFTLGLAKKILIADNISVFANAGFNSMESLTMMEAWLSSLSYTMQLYFDFSGYCDMAMGIALMFNIRLPLNFNSPYKSLNIQDFWRRWHITLGRFMTNYLYIPLGGNRKGTKRTLINLVTVFLVSGLWHGAGWGFIIWGTLHGFSILIHRLWKTTNLKMPKILGWAITFFCVNIFWIFFRAESLDDALRVSGALFDFASLPSLITLQFKVSTHYPMMPILCYALLAFSIFLALTAKNSFQKTLHFQPKISAACEIIVWFCLSICLLNKSVTFLYFNF